MDCGRMATLQVRAGLDAAQEARWSIGISEIRKTDNEFSDTFVTFSKKVWNVVWGEHDTRMAQRMLTLKNQNIKYAGAVVAKQMMSAIQHLNSPDTFNAASMQVLRNIEVLFRRDVASASYTKLVRIAQLCKNDAAWCALTAADATRVFVPNPRVFHVPQAKVVDGHVDALLALRIGELCREAKISLPYWNNITLV